MSDRIRGSITVVAKENLKKGHRVAFSSPTVHPHLGLPNVILVDLQIESHIGIAEQAANAGDVTSIAPLFHGVVDVSVVIGSGDPDLHPGTMIRSAVDGQFTTDTNATRINAGIAVTPGLNVAAPSSGSIIVDCQMITMQWSK